MDICLHPARLSGKTLLPQSKSIALRVLLCAFLKGQGILNIEDFCDDVRVMKEALRALDRGDDRIDCGSSAAVLRFLLPVCGALGRSIEFTGSPRLAERPLKELLEAMAARGCRFSGERLPLKISGKLVPGEYCIPGNVSSQYASGLYLAFQLIDGECRLSVSGRLESAGYFEMTELLAQVYFEDGASIAPGDIPGDASAAAFWLAANSAGSLVEFENEDDSGIQPDSLMREYLKQLGGEIDVSDCPDLAPPLAAAAALYPGKTVLTGASRLRFKESDRLKGLSDMINALGGSAELKLNELHITGGPVKGGCVCANEDHRIAMAAAVMASAAEGPVTVKGAECVSKSYPLFFEEYRALGGRADVLQQG